MITFQDFQAANTTEGKRQAFIQQAISHHKTTDSYKRAFAGYKYYCRENLTIFAVEKWLTNAIGERVRDYISPNHKCANGLFKEFIRQENECLLSNGVSFQDDATKIRLGGTKFDLVLKKLGKAALWGGVSFGFLNWKNGGYYVQPFNLLEFVPLFDEETGGLMAGIYFWQLAGNKPLRATLYEIDGYADYLFDTREGEKTKILTPKRSYKLTLSTSEFSGVQILNGENYRMLPIVPFFGNEEKQSELTNSLRNLLDAYDMILSGFTNLVDETSEIYWTLRNVGGMDELDAITFRDTVRRLKIALDTNGNTDATPNTIDVPYAARDAILTRLASELYASFGAVDYRTLSTHTATATEIQASYTALNYKVSEYEMCAIDFINGVLDLIGVEDAPSFTREKIINTSEEIDNVLKCANALSQEYITKKLLTLLGDIDQVEQVREQMEQEESIRYE